MISLFCLSRYELYSIFDLIFVSRVLVCWKDQGISSLMLVIIFLLDIESEFLSCLVALFVFTGATIRLRDALL